jgi:hypothetical protein
LEIASAMRCARSPHGHRPVYLFGRQVDDAKVWTSALFINFG